MGSEGLGRVRQLHKREVTVVVARIRGLEAVVREKIEGVELERAVKVVGSVVLPDPGVGNPRGLEEEREVFSGVGVGKVVGLKRAPPIGVRHVGTAEVPPQNLVGVERTCWGDEGGGGERVRSETWIGGNRLKVVEATVEVKGLIPSGSPFDRSYDRQSGGRCSRLRWRRERGEVGRGDLCSKEAWGQGSVRNVVGSKWSGVGIAGWGWDKGMWRPPCMLDGGKLSRGFGWEAVHKMRLYFVDHV